jgi:hypothetical protein
VAFKVGTSSGRWHHRLDLLAVVLWVMASVRGGGYCLKGGVVVSKPRLRS